MSQGSSCQHLRASGHFSSGSTYDGHGDMDYIFSAKLEKLEEVDNDGCHVGTNHACYDGCYGVEQFRF